ncbi:hypothetical protein CYMTET_16055 [Cymbomonas tetramitiformis]|uniref:J domain-containing protein n=1 Tax=Cymbomonas tetramitiformis TaxID=36881 RepID=A0AAE0GD69_9CHLO|nr:hypothetical protein CYMTET_16055 [Cymbomonas tetramitiformis]
MSDDVYFTRSANPQTSARGSGLVSYDEEEATRQQTAKQRNIKGEKIRITDKAAFQRFMQRATVTAVESAAEHKETVKERRERERMLREGAAWRPPSDDSAPDPSKLKHFDRQKDYYMILHLDRAASSKEVTKHYKKKALELHPDKQHDKTDEERDKLQLQFQEVLEAYEALIDDPTVSLRSSYA